MDVEDQAGGGYTDADIEGRTPMARFARPEDIAQAVAFLADPASAATLTATPSPWAAAGTVTGAGRASGTASRATEIQRGPPSGTVPR